MPKKDAARQWLELPFTHPGGLSITRDFAGESV
jgi:hypothetical protein